MDTVVRIFAGIANTQECAIDLAHHTRKQPAGTNGNGDYGAADMRGASAVHDALRAVRVLNRMSDKDAEILGIPEQDRAKYFRVDRAKGNNAPATKAVWHQFINVSLPNGDEVGVVAAWELPGQGAPSPEMDEANRRTERIFLLLLARKKRTVGTAITGNYAPRLFAKEREAREANVSQGALEAAMWRLLDTNRIYDLGGGKDGRRRSELVINETREGGKVTNESAQDHLRQPRRCRRSREPGRGNRHGAPFYCSRQERSIARSRISTAGSREHGSFR